ncbi:MAG TPA: DMT family transporter [Kofleriaceae bacterium]
MMGRGGSSAHRLAPAMLFLATVGWGVGFTWAKSAQDAANEYLHASPEAAAGPVLLLGICYTAAGLLLLATIGRARRGWSGASLRRALVLGALLGGALGLQHLGLARTSEAVSAFLTSLAVLIVPLIMRVVFRRAPPRAFWCAAILATVGVWLIGGATRAGLGLGETLGIGCAALYSVYLIAINLVVPKDDPWRMICGQFLFLGVVMLLGAWWMAGAPLTVTLEDAWALLRYRAIWREAALLTLFSTLLPFVLMNVYQPRVSPTRAALIYLLEPLVATAYAYVAQHRALGLLELAGASLIIIANALQSTAEHESSGIDDAAACEVLAGVQRPGPV